MDRRFVPEKVPKARYKMMKRVELTDHMEKKDETLEVP